MAEVAILEYASPQWSWCAGNRWWWVRFCESKPLKGKRRGLVQTLLVAATRSMASVRLMSSAFSQR